MSGKNKIIISCNPSGSSLCDLNKIIKNKEEEYKKAIIVLGDSGVSAAESARALGNALKKLKPLLLCPEDMMIMDPNIDFSRLERIVMDSMIIGPKPTKFAGRCYDESGEISKRTYKKLLKKLDKEEKVSHKQDQTDRWCNKWDRKIKRKL